MAGIRFLVATDLHASEEAADKLILKLNLGQPAGKFDGLILLGDITHNGPISFAEDFISSLKSLGVKVYSVIGNMDPTEVRELLEREKVSIHAKKRSLGDGWSIAGFGGSRQGGAGTPMEFSEEEIYSGLSKLRINSKTILVTHSPPFGVAGFDVTRSGVGIGSTAVKRVIEEFKPAASLCGHVHEREGITRFNSTLVVKVAPAAHGRAAVLELGENIKAELVDI